MNSTLMHVGQALSESSVSNRSVILNPLSMVLIVLTTDDSLVALNCLGNWSHDWCRYFRGNGRSSQR